MTRSSAKRVPGPPLQSPQQGPWEANGVVGAVMPGRSHPPPLSASENAATNSRKGLGVGTGSERGFRGPSPGLVVVYDKSTAGRRRRSGRAARTVPPWESETPWIPRSVGYCRAQSRCIKLWKRSAPGEPMWQVFRCYNIRCERCAPLVSRRDFARLLIALEPYRAEDTLVAVLTLDPDRETVSSLEEVYRGLEKKWTRFQRILTKTIGKFPFGNFIEAMRNGLPHMNVVIPSPTLARWLEAEPATGYQAEKDLAPRWFMQMATEAGFGFRVSLKRFHTKEAAASYCTKQAKAVKDGTGEVTKLSQYPVRAPRKFRRVRSSKGFFERAATDPELTGEFRPHAAPQVVYEALGLTWSPDVTSEARAIAQAIEDGEIAAGGTRGELSESVELPECLPPADGDALEGSALSGGVLGGGVCSGRGGLPTGGGAVQDGNGSQGQDASHHRRDAKATAGLLAELALKLEEARQTDEAGVYAARLRRQRALELSALRLDGMGAKAKAWVVNGTSGLPGPSP